MYEKQKPSWFFLFLFIGSNVIEKSDIETVIEYFRQETVHIETTWSIRHPYAVGSTLFNSQVQCRCNPSAFEIFFLSNDIYFKFSKAFSHFYVNQLFITDPKMCRNCNLFYQRKVGYISKILEVFNTALTAQSAQNQKVARYI